MCTKADVAEIIGLKIEPIEKSIIRIEKRLDEMPCQDLMKQVIRVEIQIENLEKLRTEDKKDIDTLYGMSRTFETDIATLKEQNKGQDAWSAKVWVFILLGIQTLAAIVTYFITRGVT